MFIVEATILAVGINDKTEALEELPLRIIVMDKAVQAIGCLKDEHINAVASRWELDDMPDGMLVKKILAAKPGTPVIVFVRPSDPEQEIAARSLGVSAVLPEDIDGEYFRDTVCQVLGLSCIRSIKSISTHKPK